MHIKRYLNKLYQINKIIKILTNEQNSKPIWLSQYNNINIENLFQDLANNSCLRYQWEGNEYGKNIFNMQKMNL